MPEVIARTDVPRGSKPPEPPPVPVAAEAPKPDDMAQRQAMLAKKERAIREQQKAVLAEKEAILAKQKDYDTNYIPKAKLLESPYQTLLDAGVKYDTVTEQALHALNSNDPVAQHIAKLEAQVKALSEGQEQVKKNIENSQTQAYEQALKQIGNEVKILVDSDENFETIKGMDAQGTVVKLIEEEFKKTGEVLSVSAACKEVEDYLEEQALKWAKLKKIQNKLNAAPAEEKPVAKVEGMKTLTNSVSVNTKPLSRKERAILAFKGQLK